MTIQSGSTDRILEHEDAFQHISDGTPKKSVKFTDGKVETSPNVHARKLSTQTLVEDINLQPKETVTKDRKTSQEKFLNVSSLWDISLPEVEWTEEDELMLEKLENSGNLDDDVMLIPDKTGKTSNPSTQQNLLGGGDSNKDNQRDRSESRRRLENLIRASTNRNAIRKPRWRLEMEHDNESISPFHEEDAEPMKQIQILRSVSHAVLLLVHLRKLLRTKRLDQKEKAMQDFESMLNIYSSATRVWLGKIVRNPLMSILQEPSLNLDLSSRAPPKGLSNKFGALFALRSSTQGTKGLDGARFVKLKVRAKGIVDAIAKAIEKNDVPAGILEFWRRLTSDGVYFPETYMIFSQERDVLEFDEFGATRNVVQMDTRSLLSEPAPATTEAMSSVISRFNVVIVNFIFVRILIPHIILHPHEIGIGSGNMSKQTASNLKALATMLYQICGLISPVPPPESNSSIARKSSISLSSRPEPEGIPSPPADEKEKVASSETRFFSIEEIGSLLIPSPTFPAEDPQVQQFAREQQTKLERALQHLQSQIHKSKVSGSDVKPTP